MATILCLHPASRTSLFTYLTLRGLQLGTIAIAGQIFSYLKWQHTFHMCYWRKCSLEDSKELTVPFVYIVFTILVI
jgi:hypothetical protein